MLINVERSGNSITSANESIHGGVIGYLLARES